jgi:hypothetical protein
MDLNTIRVRYRPKNSLFFAVYITGFCYICKTLFGFFNTVTVKHFLTLSLVCVVLCGHAQHEHADPPEQLKRHRIAMVIGHTGIRAASGGELQNKEVFLPSWGLDYNYMINSRWSIGWLNDLELSSYVIEHPDHEMELEREFPFISVIAVYYRPWKHLVFLAGPGMEFEKKEHFFVMKFGVEYGVRISQGWDLTPMFTYHLKDGSFGAWTLGLGVGKSF